MLKLYWRYLQKRKLEALKTQVRMMGGNPDNEDDEADANKKEAAAMAGIENPIAGFPDDIDYFNEKHCKAKIEITKRFHGKLQEEACWNEHRMQACLGKHGFVAKRCSMNDVLWGRFLQHGDKLTMNDIKKMVQFDIKRRELYPPDYKGVGNEPPPESYLAELRESGRLKQIHQDLDELTGG